VRSVNSGVKNKKKREVRLGEKEEGVLMGGGSAETNGK